MWFVLNCDYHKTSSGSLDQARSILSGSRRYTFFTCHAGVQKNCPELDELSEFLLPLDEMRDELEDVYRAFEREFDGGKVVKAVSSLHRGLEKLQECARRVKPQIRKQRSKRSRDLPDFVEATKRSEGAEERLQPGGKLFSSLSKRPRSQSLVATSSTEERTRYKAKLCK